MKKILLVTLLLLTTIFCLHAQASDSKNLSKKLLIRGSSGLKEYSGFIINLNNKDTYGFTFDILDDRNTTARHFQNPVPFCPKGIQKKEDAYKIAEWIVDEFMKTGQWNNTIPESVARQLGIEFRQKIQN